MTPRRRDGLFRALLRLFPSDMRESHGREMEQVLREQHRQRRPGLAASLAFWLGAIYDVLRVAPRQHAEALGQDVRYALRGLRRTPAFAVVALATIALGTGATSAVFAVVNSVLIRPLPYADAERIALVWAVTPDGSRTWLSPPELDDIRERATSLDDVAGLTDLRFALTGGGAPEEVNVVGASANLFPMLGTHPVIGRLFQPSDDVENATRVVVLGHGLWARRFGMSPAVLGTTMMLDGRPYTVVGVLPKGFGIVPPSPVFPARVDAWVTLQTHLPTRARDVRFLHAVARVRRDVELGSAREQVATIGPALSRDFSDAYRGRTWNFDLVSMQADVVRGVKPALLILLATVGLVLLIAAANVATFVAGPWRVEASRDGHPHRGRRELVATDSPAADRRPRARAPRWRSGPGACRARSCRRSLSGARSTASFRGRPHRLVRRGVRVSGFLRHCGALHACACASAA